MSISAGVQIGSVTRPSSVHCGTFSDADTASNSASRLFSAVTALKSLDAEFEAVSASLKVPFYKTFWRVTLPICTPALIDIARYFFINAMTTISAVVFLYSPETKVASIAILNLDEAGDTGAAAAMAVLIAVVSSVATGLFMLLGWWADRRTQAWKFNTSR